MLKIVQWLLGFSAFMVFWSLLLGDYFNFSERQQFHVWMLPVYTVGIVGLGCLTLLIIRVYTFNDCKSAAVELKKEIEEARADLRKRGFKFDD